MIVNYYFSLNLSFSVLESLAPLPQTGASRVSWSVDLKNKTVILPAKIRFIQEYQRIAIQDKQALAKL